MRNPVRRTGLLLTAILAFWGCDDVGGEGDVPDMAGVILDTGQPPDQGPPPRYASAHA